MPESARFRVGNPTASVSARLTTRTLVSVIRSPSLIAAPRPGLTRSSRSWATPSSLSAPTTRSAVTVVLRGLASATLTVRVFGVTTPRRMPERLIAVPRLADRSAPLNRRPSWSRAESTSVAVTQYRLDRPSTCTSSGRP
jgi:hypothetical protein